MRAQGGYRDLSGAHDDRVPPGAPRPWRYRTVVLPCLAAFAVSGLIMWAVVYPLIIGSYSAQPVTGWTRADLAGQVGASLAAAALLIAAAQRPRWRRVIALTAWAIVGLQIGWSVTASAHPANWCAARPGWAAITLNNTEPEPVVTAPPGAHIVVTVPGWDWGTATDVNVIGGGMLREVCTVLLPGGGRRTIFLAARPGSDGLYATVQPASNLMMPAWGGKVIVRGVRA